MAVTISDLTVTEGYADGSTLTQAQLNTAMTSIETHSNTKLARNVEQVAKDGWGNANYTLNDDGAASLTNTLFDKQTGTTTYVGGDINIATAADGAYADVDAVNASIAFTPEIAGKYKVTFHFTHKATSNATTEFEIDTSFRLSDGTTGSPSVNSGGYMAATAANSGKFVHPVALSYIFTWTAAAKTVTLQKYNRTCTSVSANVVCATAASGSLYMTVEKV